MTELCGMVCEIRRSASEVSVLSRSLSVLDEPVPEDFADADDETGIFIHMVKAYCFGFLTLFGISSGSTIDNSMNPA